MSFRAPESPYRVPFDGTFRIADTTTAPPEDASDRKKLRKKLDDRIDDIRDLQEMLYAHDRHAVLLVFQAMDAAGKDSTIRAVMTGINPAGCQVFSFKRPSSEELDHDFLWRTARRLPERGRIGIFNRSHYEEVLVVRVHPSILESQNLPDPIDPATIWDDRLTSIRDHEAHLARNGTVVLKFFLNVSKDEQRRRFLDRIDTPRKNWKFSAGDLDERARWPDYMHAYEQALNATSRPHAPWYAIPADDKRYMRATVAGIVRDALRSLDLSFPTLTDQDRASLATSRDALETEP